MQLYVKIFRTLQGYSTGLHIFEIMWPVHQRGTHAAIGVSTDRQTLHSIGYSTLIGQSDQSWGWDLGRLKVDHSTNFLTFFCSIKCNSTLLSQCYSSQRFIEARIKILLMKRILSLCMMQDVKMIYGWSAQSIKYDKKSICFYCTRASFY